MVRLAAAGGLGAELLELLDGDGNGAGVPLALAGLLGVLEEGLAEGGVARVPAGGLSDGLTTQAEGGGGELLDLGDDKELILLVVDGGLVKGTTEGLVEGGHDGVTGGVHGLTVKVSAGLPGDQDGGLPHEGENILEALTEGGTVVDGGGLGDEADAGGILGDLGSFTQYNNDCGFSADTMNSPIMVSLMHRTPYTGRFCPEA